ncbi:MAG TPA: ABC transporter permease [Acidimicrobiales bacterium]|nr:ABC transporter permease [Acidimicrobiales bacterium]
MTAVAATPRWTALRAFGAFEIGRLLRSWKFLAITVGFPVVFYLLFLRNHPGGEVVDAGVQWRVYLMVAMCSFGALVAGLTGGGGRLSMERASGWARQLRVTPLPAWAYLAVKAAASLVVVFPVVGIVEVLGATFGGVQLGVGIWFGLTGVLLATSVPFAVLGVFVGSVVGPEAAFPVVTALMFVLGYFGGLFGPVDQMPGALQGVAHVLPNYHQVSLGLGVAGDAGGGLSHWLVLLGYTVVLAGLVLWRHRVDETRAVA